MPARVALAASGDDGREARRVDVGEVEPPREQPRDRVLARPATARAPVRVPSSATPTDPVLKPRACAPTTLRSTPPNRPS